MRPAQLQPVAVAEPRGTRVGKEVMVENTPKRAFGYDFTVVSSQGQMQLRVGGSTYGFTENCVVRLQRHDVVLNDATTAAKRKLQLTFYQHTAK